MSDILGAPGTGIHSYRIFNIAIVDLLLTVLGAYIIARVLKKKFVYVLIILLLLGIIMHRLFKVRTTVDKILFPNAE